VKYQITQLLRHLNGRLAIGLGIASLLAAPAQAQLIEVLPNGATATYAGPVTASPEGMHPIALERPSAHSDKEPVILAIRDAATHHKLSEQLVEAVAWQESRLRQGAISPKGARGVMQLMPQTAQGLGVNAQKLASNVDGGTAYLARMMTRFDGDLIKALAAYNAGPDAVAHYGGVPPYPETKAYVAAILDRLSMGGAKTIAETRP
jgi:soluble lytic murein transglycosylase-like protein